MEITHLDKNVLFGAFAKACSDFDGGFIGGGNCFADELGIGCPFEGEHEEQPCSDIKPEHWRDVFECEDKPGSEFQFGDKVMADQRQAVFVHYQHGTTKKAEVLYKGDEVTSTVTTDSIKAGWWV